MTDTEANRRGRLDALGFIDAFRTAATNLPVARHEREQANIRIAIVLAANAYLVLGRIFELFDPGLSNLYLLMFVGALGFSLLIRATLIVYPFASLLRRLATMVFDYGILVATIAVGNEFAAPIYAIILWITVGYGMRFGQWYLLAGTAASLVGILVIGTVSPFWSRYPSLVGMLLLTAMIVPAYANLLLRETRRSRDAALSADMAKSRFLAQASHDLRQPIHAISLFTACIREEGLTDNQRQMTDNVDKALDSVSRLFRSLLDISMLDSGRMAVHPAAMRLGPLLEGIRARNAEAARATGSRLHLVPTRAVVETDGDLLETMIQNLVSNALKHAPGADIVLGCRRRGNTVSIWVADRGPGIAAEELDRIFTEFYRIPQPGRDVDGIGLGLAIVQRMARLIGCRVTAASRVGHGSLFTIDGLARAPASRIPTAAALRQVDRDDRSLAGVRVLLVEDNAQVLEASTQLLQRWGCHVQAHATPHFEAQPVDIILTDFDLDDPHSGVAVIDRVRRALDADIPALLMTGHDEGRVQEAIGRSGIPVLQKPLRPVALRAALTRLVATR